MFQHSPQTPFYIILPLWYTPFLILYKVAILWFDLLHESRLSALLTVSFPVLKLLTTCLIMQKKKKKTPKSSPTYSRYKKKAVWNILQIERDRHLSTKLFWVSSTTQSDRAWTDKSSSRWFVVCDQEHQENLRVIVWLRVFAFLNLPPLTWQFKYSKS